MILILFSVAIYPVDVSGSGANSLRRVAFFYMLLTDVAQPRQSLRHVRDLGFAGVARYRQACLALDAEIHAPTGHIRMPSTTARCEVEFAHILVACPCYA
jgi:hypothetical protein